MKTILAKLWRALHLPTNLQLRIMRVVNDEFLIGLTAIILNDKNEILIVKHSYRDDGWSLPGGYLKAKEHPTEGLEREIKEETGFIISVDKPLKVRTDRTTGRLDMCYIGTFIGGEFKKSEEIVEYGFFSFENLPLLLSGQIHFIKEALIQLKHQDSVTFSTLPSKQALLQKLKHFI